MRFWRRQSSCRPYAGVNAVRQRPCKGCGYILALLVLACSVSAATNDTLTTMRREKARLVEKEFDQLSDKTLSDRTKLALDDKIKWRHGETDHFVYHFQRLTEAQKLAREAEFYCWKIKEDLGVKDDLAQGKSHIVIFSREDLWKIFIADAGIPGWSVGFAFGRELFLLVEPGSSNASDRLAHEMTHLVFFRFVSKTVPLWLNEGFAEFESQAAYAKLKGVGVAAPKTGRAMPMNIDRLTSLTIYPEDPREVQSFYVASERLVRFLITRHAKESFVPFVNLLADGATFEQALLEKYTKYRKLEEFKKQFERFQ